MEKMCASCKSILSISDFGRSKQTSDGLYPYCKKCHSTRSLARYHGDSRVRLATIERGKKWAASHRDLCRTRNLNHARSEKGKATRKKIAAAWEKSERGRRWRKRWREKNRRVIAAHAAVRNAIRSGKMVRPQSCERCSSEKNIQAHHHRGYSAEFNLDVVWLCSGCHAVANYEKKPKKPNAAIL